MIKYTIENNYMPKEYAMKKIISLILCVLMIVPLFAFASFAADENTGNSDEPFNFALRGSAYATSKWNNDSDPKYINNGDQADSYRYWRPNGHGRDIYMSRLGLHC